MNLLDLDPRWRRLNDPDWACPCCSVSWGGVFDIGYDHPDLWEHAPRGDQDLVEAGSDRLTAELCRAGDHRLIRVTLMLPVRGSGETLGIATWAEPPEEVFFAYFDTLSGAPAPAPCIAALGNDLPGFATDEPLLGQLDFGDGSARPVFTADSGPLAKAQQDGIGLDDLLTTYAASGNDIRPHLAQG